MQTSTVQSGGRSWRGPSTRQTAVQHHTAPPAGSSVLELQHAQPPCHAFASCRDVTAMLWSRTCPKWPSCSSVMGGLPRGSTPSHLYACTPGLTYRESAVQNPATRKSKPFGFATLCTAEVPHSAGQKMSSGANCSDSDGYKMTATFSIIKTSVTQSGFNGLKSTKATSM